MPRLRRLSVLFWCLRPARAALLTAPRPAEAEWISRLCQHAKKGRDSHFGGTHNEAQVVVLDRPDAKLSEKGRDVSESAHGCGAQPCFGRWDARFRWRRCACPRCAAEPRSPSGCAPAARGQGASDGAGGCTCDAAQRTRHLVGRHVARLVDCVEGHVLGDELRGGARRAARQRRYTVRAAVRRPGAARAPYVVRHEHLQRPGLGEEAHLRAAQQPQRPPEAQKQAAPA